MDRRYAASMAHQFSSLRGWAISNSRVLSVFGCSCRDNWGTGAQRSSPHFRWGDGSVRRLLVHIGIAHRNWPAWSNSLSICAEGDDFFARIRHSRCAVFPNWSACYFWPRCVFASIWALMALAMVATRTWPKMKSETRSRVPIRSRGVGSVYDTTIHHW